VPFHHLGRGPCEVPLPMQVRTDRVLEKIARGDGKIGNKEWKQARAAILKNFKPKCEEAVALLLLAGSSSILSVATE
jgi:hypothetical protein